MSSQDFLFLSDTELVAQPVVTSTREWRKEATGRFSDVSGNRVLPMFSSIFRSKRPHKVTPVDVSGAVLNRFRPRTPEYH